MVAVSCTASRDLTHTDLRQTTDSVIIRQEVRVDTLRIAADSVVMRIPYSVAIHDTVIVVRNKWARARVVIRDSIAYITASCDSLQRLVLSYQKQVETYRATERNIEKTLTEKTNRILPRYILVIVGVILLILIIVKFLLKFLLK